MKKQETTFEAFFLFFSLGAPVIGLQPNGETNRLAQHVNECNALSQSESSNLSIYIIRESIGVLCYSNFFAYSSAH